MDKLINLTSGKNMWEFSSFNEEDSPIRVSDGPTGLRYVTNSDGTVDEESENATCFPSECACANTFNEELLYKMGKALAMDCKHKNVDILLAPGVNIKRIPHCGRNFEYYSEDPFLSGYLASSLINGLQDYGVGCCVKHFACNNSEFYRFTNSSIVDKRALNEIYLYPFKYIIKNSNPVSIMTSYNKINNQYVSENKELLDYIRKDFGFKGLFVSDWGGIYNPINAVNAGLNIEMPGNHYSKTIVNEGYEKGLISKETLINNAKIIEENYSRLYEMRNIKHNYDPSFSKKTAYEVASEAPVLLKNDNVLPLKNDDDILVCGELFEIPNTQGFGSSKINYKNDYTFLDEFKNYNSNVIYKKGYSLFNEDDSLLLDCLNEAKKHEKIVVFAGYIYGDCEGVDRDSIDLPLNQLNLINELIKLNKKIIVVINTGSVVTLPFKDKVNGILYSSLLGQWQENVVTKILFGDINPSGKLSETIPLSYNDVDLHSRSDITTYYESIFVGYRYYETFNKEVAYPFGFGLSYSNFELKNIKFNKLNREISLDIENKSNIKGSEVIQVYVRKINSKTYNPNKELKAIMKIALNPFENKRVSITLEDDSFEFFDDTQNKFVIEDCDYEILVGNSSDNVTSVDIVSIKGEIINPRLTKKDIPSYFSNKDINKEEFKLIFNDEIIYNDYTKFDINTPLIYFKDKEKSNDLYLKLRDIYVKQNSLFPKEMAIKIFNYMPIRIVSNWTNGLINYFDIIKIIEEFNK